MLAVVLVTAAPSAGLPAINDITTSPDDPPGFVATAAELGEPMAYGGDTFAAAAQLVTGMTLAEALGEVAIDKWYATGVAGFVPDLPQALLQLVIDGNLSRRNQTPRGSGHSRLLDISQSRESDCGQLRDVPRDISTPSNAVEIIQA